MHIVDEQQLWKRLTWWQRRTACRLTASARPVWSVQLNPSGRNKQSGEIFLSWKHRKTFDLSLTILFFICVVVAGLLYRSCRGAAHWRIAVHEELVQQEVKMIRLHANSRTSVKCFLQVRFDHLIWHSLEHEGIHIKPHSSGCVLDKTGAIVFAFNHTPLWDGVKDFPHIWYIFKKEIKPTKSCTKTHRLSSRHSREAHITQSFLPLETEGWRCGNSQESHSTSGHTVACVGKWTEPQPESTWVAQAHTHLTETTFPTELKKQRHTFRADTAGTKYSHSTIKSEKKQTNKAQMT